MTGRLGETQPLSVFEAQLRWERLPREFCSRGNESVIMMSFLLS
jgi:hypothetical protein